MKEKEPDFNIRITPTEIAKAIGQSVVDLASKLSHLPQRTLASHGDNFLSDDAFEYSTGAEAMLSRIQDAEGEAYSQEQLFSTTMYDRFTEVR